MPIPAYRKQRRAYELRANQTTSELAMRKILSRF